MQFENFLRKCILIILCLVLVHWCSSKNEVSAEMQVDSDRRSVYDLRGVTNEDAFIRKNGPDGRFATDQFEEFFG